MFGKHTKVLLVGSAIGLLNVVVTNVYLAGRPVGASTSYPFVAGVALNLEATEYFAQIRNAGSWEFLFLLGAFVGALAGAVAFGHFKLRLVPPLWAELKGRSATRRLVWSLVGGFLLILGARLADGCTSGHILSGGMELAVSSLVFAGFVGVALLAAARRFYAGATP